MPLASRGSGPGGSAGARLGSPPPVSTASSGCAAARSADAAGRSLGVALGRLMGRFCGFRALIGTISAAAAAAAAVARREACSRADIFGLAPFVALRSIKD